jgi:decaprenylphospho-beta-D-ribofuranose 2-oxidase
MASSARQLLTGWGRTSPSAALVLDPRDEHELCTWLESQGSTEAFATNRIPDLGRGVIARGLGRSYGDAAQCGGSSVIRLGNFSDIGPIGDDGAVRVGGGVSLDLLIRASLPQGWFVPVSPGTRQVTIGGAIAADVHGKNHHQNGSFDCHVPSVTIATPTGLHRASPEENADLFWATAGGMGLTGVITDATVQMIPVETSWMKVDQERFSDLDSLMSAMDAHDSDYRYSVAWVDCTARGRHLGRGILTRGDHAALADLGPRQRSEPLLPPLSRRWRVPASTPDWILNPLTIALFNETWYRRSPKRQLDALHAIPAFFHPLDAVENWNLLYGRMGFVQYQFVVGLNRSETVRQAIELLSSARIPSFLAVLKRFGPADPGPLSFPMEGWTLALDLPIGPDRLGPLLDELDLLVAEAGGRIYFAKDARMRPEFVPAMYPRLSELARVRMKVDPSGMLRSDLSRRLGLDYEENS